MSTLSILNYFVKVATMRGFSNISVTSSLGVVVSYSLNNMAASGARDERSKEDE